MSKPAGARRIFRALKNPNYGLYTAGSSVSLVGTWMQRVAVGWLAWQLTESAAWLGALAFAELFPTLVIAPLAGAMADRLDRLKVLRFGQTLMLLQSLALCLLTWTGVMTIWWLLALTVLLGIVVAFNQPNRLALIPSLVTRDDLSAAVAINAVIFNSARFIGPAIAGVAIVTVGVAAAFAANVLATGLFILALFRISVPGGRESTPRELGGFLAGIGEGLAYAWRHGAIAPLLLLLAAVSVFTRPFVELLPGFAEAVFASGAQGLALMTSTIGLGAMVAGLWLAGRDPARPLVPLALGSPLLGAIALFAFVLSPGLALALPALFFVGVAMVTGGIATQTLLQFAVAGALRGRVMSLYGLIFRAGPGLGALVMGAFSEVFGLRLPVAAGALLTVLAWALVWRRRSAVSAAVQLGNS